MTDYAQISGSVGSNALGNQEATFSTSNEKTDVVVNDLSGQTISLSHSQLLNHTEKENPCGIFFFVGWGR